MYNSYNNTSNLLEHHGSRKQLGQHDALKVLAQLSVLTKNRIISINSMD